MYNVNNRWQYSSGIMHQKTFSDVLKTDRNTKFSNCWDSATCEPSDAAEVQNSTFFYIPDHRILRSTLFRPEGRQDSDLCCLMCRFPLVVAKFECDHNPPALETDRQTDGRHARSINAKCRAKMTSCRLIWVPDGRESCLQSLGRSYIRSSRPGITYIYFTVK